MKFHAGFMFMFALLIFGACSQKEKLGDINASVRELSKAKTLKEWRNLYTKETVRVIDSGLSSGAIDKGSEIHYLLPMGDGIGYLAEILSREKESARVRLTLEQHPRENMRGANLEVPLELEDGKWKFNLSADIRRGLKSRGTR